MSRKRILNLTSEKKRDTMLIATNVVAPRNPTSTTFTTNPAVLTGGSGTEYVFAFCATARDATVNAAGTVGNKYTAATRTATTCYMRGLSERIEIQVNDGTPWQWRRICFTAKGFQNILPASSGFAYYQETSAGYARVVAETSGTQNGILYDVLFKGARGQDWSDPLYAPTDQTRVRIMYDQTTTISSGNEDGVIRLYKRWMPMNKNLVYNDDEVGGNESTALFSTLGRQGMGDYWVIDLFRPRTGSSTSNTLSFAPNSSLYWHEK